MKHASTPPIGEPGALSHPQPLFHIGSHSSALCSDFSGLRNVPFGDEVQTNTHHTHDHTPTAPHHHQPHTRSQYKRSLCSGDARQRTEHNSAYTTEPPTGATARTPTTSPELSQGTGSLDRPHQKPLYDLTGRTLSHRRLLRQRSRQQQHTAAPPLPATASNTHRFTDATDSAGSCRTFSS